MLLCDRNDRNSDDEGEDSCENIARPAMILSAMGTSFLCCLFLGEKASYQRK